MTTPIYDFVRRYQESGAARLHMPGHKGSPRLGCEGLDITEIDGADNLFAPSGIIAQSEQNASMLFGCKTVYSAEGSSLCIRAMLYLAMQYAAACGKKPIIAAARNAHKSFLTAAVLLDFEILWLPQDHTAGYLSCTVTPDSLRRCIALADESPAALYVTAPDYLGNLADIAALSQLCHENGMLLLVDHAHGAYLRFLPKSLHPIDLGADLCCDSAHKTLPVLTGGAYLHIADGAPPMLAANCKAAMSLFASTSPSYLILASLDCCNGVLAGDYPAKLCTLTAQLAQYREQLTAAGFTLCGSEPMKLTIAPKSFGYTGTALAALLHRQGIVCEFADPDYLVLMPSPDTPQRDLERLTEVLLAVPRRSPVTETLPPLPLPERILSPRQALFAAREQLPLSQCAGRICAELTVSCPPAVPIVICGERIDNAALRCLMYYGAETCTVVRESAGQ